MEGPSGGFQAHEPRQALQGLAQTKADVHDASGGLPDTGEHRVEMAQLIEVFVQGRGQLLQWQASRIGKVPVAGPVVAAVEPLRLAAAMLTVVQQFVPGALQRGLGSLLQVFGSGASDAAMAFDVAKGAGSDTRA